MRLIARRDLLKTLCAGAAAGAALRALPARATTEDHLRIGVQSFPQSLNPFMVQDLAAVVLLSSMYEGLTTIDRHGRLQPGLAIAWEASDNARRWRLHLRRGVRFHNGRPFTAQDVKRSFEAAASPNGGVSFSPRMVGKIAGYSAKIKGEAPTLAGIEVVSDDTLDVLCENPCATFPFLRIHIVDLDSTQRGDEHWHTGLAAGTGPYCITGPMTGNRLTLAANEHWWKGAPLYRHVSFVATSGKENVITLFENGDIDFSLLDADDVHRVADEPGFKRALVSCDRLQTRAIAFNSDRYPAFGDPRVRRALSLMIDREAMVERFYRGRAKVQHGVVPPAMLDDDHLAPLRYDPAAARDLLASAGYRGGAGLEPLTLVTPQEYRREFAYYASQWSNLGLPTTVQSLPRGEYVKRARNKEYQAFLLGWTASYPDPMNFLDEMFSSRSPFNHSGWSNATFDALLGQAMTIADPQERTPIYRRAERQLMEDMPIVPLVVPDYVALRGNVLSDNFIPPFGGLNFG